MIENVITRKKLNLVKAGPYRGSETSECDSEIPVRMSKTYLFEVLPFLYGRNNIVESVFIAFGCHLDFLHRFFKRLPFDARCKHIILAENVVAVLTQKNKLLLNVWSKNRMSFQNHLSTKNTFKKYIFQSLKPSFIPKLIKY